jgi:hypothetical protein
MDQAGRFAPLRQYAGDNLLRADMRLAHVLDLNASSRRQGTPAIRSA